MIFFPSINRAPKSRSQSLSLRKNFSWTFGGNVIYAACQWGMLSVLAKLGSPELVGQFALALAITSPVMAFFNLQLRGIQATDAKGEFQFGDYFALRILTTVAALLVIAGVMFLADYDRSLARVILIVALGKAFDAGSDVIYGLFQHREQMDRVAKGMVINGSLSLIALGLGVALTGSLLLGVLGSSMASAATLFVYNVPMAARMLTNSVPSGGNGQFLESRLSPRWSRDVQVRLLGLALPLGIVMLLGSLNGNMPQYFIEQSLGQHDLGVYAALAYLIVAGSTVVGALGQSASPRLARLYVEGQYQGFKRLLLRLVILGVLIGVAGALLSTIAGSEILTVLFTNEYAEQAETLFVLALAAGVSFAASFLGYGMTAARKFRAQVPILVLVVISSLAACALFVPEYGLPGGAIAVMLGAMVQVAGCSFVLLRALQTTGTKDA